MMSDQLPVQPLVVELEAAEAEWEYAPGRLVRGYGYNGRVPGPVIQARRGQALVVRLRNRLPEPTTIHWHGLRVPAAMDGTELVQRPIPPGGSFEYLFELPDAGTFWYHPHTNETEQLEKGLYGALVVRGRDEPAVDRERVLVLDDVKLNRRGSLVRFGGLMQRHDGRRGGVLLVNGRADTTLGVHAGQIERWRVVNAASSRYVQLTVGWREVRIIGSPMAACCRHRLQQPRCCSHPEDRVDLAVGPFQPGDELALEGLPYSRGMVKEDRLLYATIKVGPHRPSRAWIPSTLRRIEPLAPADAVPTRTIHLGGKRSLRRGVDFFINQECTTEPSLSAPAKCRSGKSSTTRRWTIHSHLHGFFFQVLQVNGSPPRYVSWEDTVNVSDRGRVRIAWLPDDRPGGWMYHCHILEHHAAGMMASFEVLPRLGAVSSHQISTLGGHHEQVQHHR